LSGVRALFSVSPRVKVGLMECDRCKSAEAILHITQVATDMLAQRQTSALSIS